MKRILLAVMVLLLLLIAGMVGRALSLRPAARHVSPAPAVELDSRMVCERLSRAIQIPSVSTRTPDGRSEGNLTRMADFLLESFSALGTALVCETHPRMLVCRWAGTEANLAPLLVLAHLDVVGADGGPESGWTHPPFSGDIAGGYIWGRGALDDKSSALAMLEAVQHLVGQGFVPRRTVILALGFDEELGGEEGAARQAERFAAEGLEPALILDEGLAVLEGLVPGLPVPVAAVGIAEKGFATLELTVRGEGGHASMPPREGVTGILAAAVRALEKNPLPATYDGTTKLFFDTLAPEMSFASRLVFANAWITAPLIRRQLAGEPSSAALIRTTTAVTMIDAGSAENVLPEVARATVNFRIHPRDTVAEVVDHARAVIDDPRVEVELRGSAAEPTSVSPIEGEAWRLLVGTIRAVYPDVTVAPALVLATTDSRHYAGLSPNVYRFFGLRLGREDLARIHGTDERIAVRNYLELIAFYLQLLRSA